LVKGGKTHELFLRTFRGLSNDISFFWINNTSVFFFIAIVREYFAGGCFEDLRQNHIGSAKRSFFFSGVVECWLRLVLSLFFIFATNMI